MCKGTCINKVFACCARTRLNPQRVRVGMFVCTPGGVSVSVCSVCVCAWKLRPVVSARSLGWQVVPKSAGQD